MGIAGPKQAGKTTLGEQLAAELGLVHTSFAAPIRQFVAKLLGMTAAELEVAKEKPVDWLGGATPRHMMQTLGTEWGRQMVHGELWVRAVLHSLPEHAVISDVRFPNEAAMIRDLGGIVLQIERPGVKFGSDHASEIPLPEALVSATLVNNGTPRDLLDKAVAILQRLGDGHGGLDQKRDQASRRSA